MDHQPLPYAEGFFDVVILASVIEHLYNPRHVVDEVARVLARGGLFVVEAPNAVALGRRLGALAGGNPFCKFNQYNALEDKALMTNCAVFYTVGEIEALLDRHFNVIDRCHCMHSPPANPVKRLLRELAFRLNPRLGDCFFVIATRE